MKEKNKECSITGKLHNKYERKLFKAMEKFGTKLASDSYFVELNLINYNDEDPQETIDCLNAMFRSTITAMFRFFLIHGKNQTEAKEEMKKIFRDQLLKWEME